MRIAIDLTSLSYHLTGIERYAMCITDKMLDLDKENTYVLVFRNEITPLFTDRIDGARVKAVVLHGENKLVFLQITLLRALNKIHADRYVFFAFPGPILFRRKGIINTIHDMGAWDLSEAMTSLSRIYFKISYRHAARVSERIITVSEFSKGRIVEILGVPKNKVCVIYSAVYDRILIEDEVPFAAIKERYELPDRYILALSTLEPRKNIRMLLEAFEDVANRVNYSLVLVGRKGWKIDEVLKTYTAKERICMTGFVEDEHLPAIYKNAMCFVFPSLYEGFGLPPVESLALGTPVVSSDAASLPEVLMDRAVYFRNDSREELEAIMRNLQERLPQMPHELNETQKKVYRFEYAAEEVLSIL